MRKFILILIIVILSSFIGASINQIKEFPIQLTKQIVKKDTTLYVVCNIDSIKSYIQFYESRKRYQIENSFGYLGAYQFGADALFDQGFLINKKPKDISNKKWLAIKENWSGKYGCWCKEDFMKNPIVQDIAFEVLVQKNYKQLYRKGINDSVLIANNYDWDGALTASHLAGADTTAACIKKKYEFKDGYGTSIYKYLAMD